MKLKGIIMVILYPLCYFLPFLAIAIWGLFLSPTQYYGHTLFYSLEEYNEFRIYAGMESLDYWVDRYPEWAWTSLNVPRGTTDYKWLGKNKAFQVYWFVAYGYLGLFGCIMTIPYIIYELRSKKTKKRIVKKLGNPRGTKTGENGRKRLIQGD